MKYLLATILTFITFSALAQVEIKLEELRNHIGDSVKLKAKIYDGKYLETAQGTPTFLNVGGKYPEAPLTLVISGDARKKFKSTPEEMYTGHQVWIVGKVTLYKNKPQIVINGPVQIYDVVAAPIESKSK